MATVVTLSMIMVATVAGAQPSLSFEEEVYDFGDVNQGQVLEHTFVFRNEGTEVLVIEKVTTS